CLSAGHFDPWQGTCAAVREPAMVYLAVTTANRDHALECALLCLRVCSDRRLFFPSTFRTTGSRSSIDPRSHPHRCLPKIQVGDIPAYPASIRQLDPVHSRPEPAFPVRSPTTSDRSPSA